MQTEMELQRQVCDELDRRGIWWRHVPRGAGRRRKQLNDIPDLICIGHGVTFYIELKRKGGKLRPGQEKFVEMCRQQEIPHAVIDRWDDAMLFLSWVATRYRVCGSCY